MARTSLLLATAFLISLSSPVSGITQAPEPADSHQSITTGRHQAAGQPGQPSEYFNHVLRHAKDLGLTQDQISTLKTFQLDFDLTRVTAETQLMFTEQEITRMIDDERVDLGAINGAIARSHAIAADLQFSAIKAVRKARALLTPAQRETIRQIPVREIRDRSPLPSSKAHGAS
jgi:hypothetical protein